MRISRSESRLTNVKIPILPLEVISVQRERYSFGLNHRERLEIISHRPRLAVSFGSGEQVGEVVEFLHWRRDSVSTREGESIISNDGGCGRSIFSRNEMRILEVDSMSGKVCRTTSASVPEQEYEQRRIAYRCEGSRQCWNREQR